MRRCPVEDKWYYWELLLVARKIGIMAAFQFFSSTVAQSWLFGSMVLMVRVQFHHLPGRSNASCVQRFGGQ